MKKDSKHKKISRKNTASVKDDGSSLLAKQAIDNAFTGTMTSEEQGDALLDFARVYGGAELSLMENYRNELEDIKKMIEDISALQSKVDEQFDLARARGQLGHRTDAE